MYVCVRACVCVCVCVSVSVSVSGYVCRGGRGAGLGGGGVATCDLYSCQVLERVSTGWSRHCMVSIRCACGLQSTWSL